MESTPPGMTATCLVQAQAEHYPDYANLRATACDLPFDVLFELFRYLPAVDIINLLSTCRGLHAHSYDISIWQRLCASFGLRDLTSFRGLSFYTVYTQLLHPYGPLIGLWANDHPYRGNIIEFRLACGEEEPGGITGEMWRFPERNFGGAEPHPPEYLRVVKIMFHPPWSSADDTALQTATVYGWHHEETDHGATPQPRMEDWHLVSLEVHPPSNHGLYLQGYRRTYSHPSFPPVNAEWLDDACRLPHLIPSEPTIIDQSELVRIYPAIRLPIVFAAPADNIKPAALSIRTACPACARHHQKFLPFDSLLPHLPRYYPLSAAVRAGVDPASALWHPAILAGLWLGTHGQQETECLHVAWDPRTGELRASKITGNIIVPRGALSWIAHTREDASAAAAPLTARHPGASRVFEGKGAVSVLGFPSAKYVDLVVGITGPDKIKIWWDQLNELRTYLRYKGREVRDPREPDSA